MSNALGVQETTTTSGTGTLTLSAISGFPRFSHAFSTNDLAMYSIINSSGVAVECGIGTVGASNTLARTYPLITWDGTTYSNVSPSAISLSGSYTVICTGVPGATVGTVPGMGSNSTKTAMASAHMSANTGGTFTHVANRMYLHPFLLVANRPLSAITFRVSTGVGSSTAYAGLYRCGITGLPTDLLEASSALTTTSSGVVVTFTLGANKKYPPGWYFMALASGSAIAVNATSSAPSASPLGVDSSNQNISAITTDLSGGFTSLPNPFSGTIANLSNSVSFPCLQAVFA